MRRYSITYFIGQSIQGLWRNGVMSLASIMVLMSCLVVMGSFALLVLNLNLNLNDFDVLNEISVFVDTTITSEEPEDTAAEEAETETEKETELPSIDVASESALAVLDIQQQVVLLDNFTDLDQAYGNVTKIGERLSAIQPMIEAISNPDERANQQIYFNQVVDDYNTVAHRINSITALEMQIQSLPNVVSTVFKSKAAGLEYMKTKFNDYQDLFINLRKNPLNDQFIVTYNDNSKVNTLKYQLDAMSDMIYKVNSYTDVADVIDNIKQGVILIFTWFLAILFVVSIAIIINTIKLAVFSRRQEISIMRYVGATNWFIVLPFIFEGIFIGLIASGVAYVFQFYMYTYVQSIVFSSLQMISFLMFSEIQWFVLFSFIGVGVLTGIVGSGVSLRKYLNV